MRRNGKREPRRSAIPASVVLSLLRKRMCTASRLVLRRGALSGDAIEVFQSDQHVAGLGAIRRSEYAGEVELIDDARRSAVADLEPALQQRGRSALVLHAHLCGLAEQLVAVADVLGSLLASPGFERLLGAHLL